MPKYQSEHCGTMLKGFVTLLALIVIVVGIIIEQSEEPIIIWEEEAPHL